MNSSPSHQGDPFQSSHTAAHLRANGKPGDDPIRRPSPAQRIPDHPKGLRLIPSLDSDIEVRKPGYLVETTANLLAGHKTADPDAVDAQASWLIAQKETDEAVFVLETLRELNFPGVPLPYLDSLAFCYFDLQRWDDAEKAFKEIAKDPAAAAELRQRAEVQLDEIKIEKRIAAARVNTRLDNLEYHTFRIQPV